MPVYLRGSVARSIYDRMMREEELKKFDRQKWYKCDINLLDEDLKQSFVEMDCDEETQKFLNLCYEKSDWLFTQMFHSFAKSILCLFMSSTSVNGLLGRGSMFVFSDNQFRLLMGENLTAQNDCLLDLGAGDGKVTSVMANYYQKVYVTEMSSVMRKLLAKNGYFVLEIDEWHQNGLTYDLISCLNLLDRCDKPLTMLSQMKSCLKPESGRIILGLVLPFSQYVESNAKSDHKPSEIISMEGDCFESQMNSLKNNVLTPNGLIIERWTKLPYLCEGDLDLTFYWLYDVVMVLKLIN